MTELKNKTVKIKKNATKDSSARIQTVVYVMEITFYKVKC